MTKQVAVFMGGWSAERDVSLVSGASCTAALRRAGYSVTAIDVQRDVSRLMDHLYPRPDVVLNALHGRYGEDGCIQGLLNIMDIPYTHSGVTASALAMDKPLAKKVFRAAGIPVAPDRIATRDEVLAGGVMEPPYVVKPFNEGSSVGIHIIQSEADGLPFAEGSWPYGPKVMIEKYVPGRELTVAVMGDRPLCVTEIRTERGFYDFDAKYAQGGSSHQLPADLPKDVYDEALRLAQAAHDALGCRGLSRADFRYDGEQLYILEVNTQPGMTPTSLAPEQAAHVGIGFEDLVTWMVENAECDA
ncbi:MAG: D-alanine--D-alanine ligase [Alphaproteobacteria bacterium]|nr:D-alanine--D-alanine ligase [Alphaproteobacteria bacterium]